VTTAELRANALRTLSYNPSLITEPHSLPIVMSPPGGGPLPRDSIG